MISMGGESTELPREGWWLLLFVRVYKEEGFGACVLGEGFGRVMLAGYFGAKYWRLENFGAKMEMFWCV
jgi:hypothetical protein